ncbi:hypothetical protein FGO68_gene1019 [Halteria grandinella]|uniref:Uncharacterized protein n=1 Tax=Halteria grandinella TaxID=5974 RepID=A0A8J8NQR6_HALGN|nr:hypothetical protein FGO68_gene1019 [Halteria grandinella]
MEKSKQLKPPSNYPFIEYTEGIPLREFLPISEDKALRFFTQICLGLSHIIEVGHKPSSITIDDILVSIYQNDQIAYLASQYDDTPNAFSLGQLLKQMLNRPAPQAPLCKN